MHLIFIILCELFICVLTHNDHSNANTDCSIDINNDILNKIQIDSLNNNRINQTHFDKFICQNLLEKVQSNECLNLILIKQNNQMNKNHTHDNHLILSIESKQWLYALLSVLIISISGFILVYLVSKINESFKRYLTPFLVALAVGTLCGDALLHLLPHAFIKHDHTHDLDHHDHTSESLKGLSALIGIYVFFIGEKLMQIKRAKKEQRHRENERLQVAKYSPKLNDDNLINGNESKEEIKNIDGANDLIAGKSNKAKLNESRLMIHGNKDLKYIADYLPNGNCNSATDALKSNLSDEEIKFNLIHNTPTSKTIDHHHNHQHGHSHTKQHHTHAHSHLTKHLKAHNEHHKHHENEIRNIKSTAWMAVMGDGLHNFCDGLAIGAAFAISQTTGLTTTIAVFFHELPHEIGNFAVLRRAGMPIKNALIFNIISSILCFIGVVCGLLIGHIDALSNAVLLFIAGTFLYISLVDMIPELAEEEETFLSFFIQSGGILVGSGIMLTIALFEEKIKNMFN